MLFVVVRSATLALTALSVSAQEAASLTETVIVTGSRIRQDPLNQPAPLVTVDAQDIAKSGLTSIGDVLQRMPVSGGGLNTKFNTSGNVGFPPDGGGVGAGAATADLRHLGPKRTLVLVDGIRWVNESSASGVGGATDLNTIPTSIIDHIEVLQDGASAIYGSDAIAGVINIITKKSYDGIEISATAAGMTRAMADTQQWNISAGTLIRVDSCLLRLELHRSEPRELCRSRNLPISDAGRGLYALAAAVRARRRAASSLSIRTPANAMNMTLNDGVDYTPDLQSSRSRRAVRAPTTIHPFTTADRFNFQPFNLITTPSERIGLYGQVETSLSENVSVYVKGLFNTRKSTNQAAPGTDLHRSRGGQWWWEPPGRNGCRRRQPVSTRFGFTLFGIDPPSGVGATDFFIGRRPLEGGPRVFQQTVDTWYAGGGFRGNFSLADRDFYWDLNGVWSRNHADQITHGSYNAQKIQNALGPGTVAGLNGATATACGPVTHRCRRADRS